MTKTQAFALFEQMIVAAEEELFSYTVHSDISIEHKADKSAVTECDKKIDARLSQMARSAGFLVVSEEGEHVQSIVESGNYFTIDPIDGTLGYIEYVNYALEHGGLGQFGKEDLGAISDFCVLLGIVENGQPRFAACYNCITKEKILLDAASREECVRLNSVRNYTQPIVAYIDQRFTDDSITQLILEYPGVTAITQAALGLKSLYTIINDHQAAVTAHRVQSAGLWDIMPAAVAARAYGGQIVDDLGQPLKFSSYIVLPGKGATIIKGDAFDFVIDELKKSAVSG